MTPIRNAITPSPSLNLGQVPRPRILDPRPGYDPISEPILKDYFNQFIQFCRDKKSRDKELWEESWEFFGEGDWTKEVFDLANKEDLKALRDFFRENGVFISKGRGINIATSLAKMVAETPETRPIWTSQEIDNQLLQNKGIFNSELRTPKEVEERYQQLLEGLQTTTPTIPTLLNQDQEKQLRQPSTYKPPIPQICRKCNTSFPSNTALHKHLPVCEPFKCIKCGAPFPSNNKLHQHIRQRKCRRQGNQVKELGFKEKENKDRESRFLELV